MAKRYYRQNMRNIAVLAVMVLGLAAGLVAIQINTAQQKSRAALGTLQCKPPANVALVIDFSGSMVREIGTNPAVANDKLQKAKEAAKSLVDQLFVYQNVKIGLVTFGTCQNSSQTAIRQSLVGSAGKAQLISAIDALSININDAGAYTSCHAEGFVLADTLLSADQTPGVAKYVLMVTDGKPVISGFSDDAAVRLTLTASKIGVDKGYANYIIGIGPKTAAEFDEGMMQCAAGVYTADTYKGGSCVRNRAVPGKYFFSPTSADLAGIVTEIGGVICEPEEPGSAPGCNYAEIVTP